MIRNEELQFIPLQQEEHYRPERRQLYADGQDRQNRNRRKKRRRAKRRRLFLTYLTAILLIAACYKTNWFTEMPALGRTVQIERIKNQADYPLELRELLEQNEETYDFVKNYPNRSDYKDGTIDLTDEFTAGTVPLLMQWDKRWGYDLYGEAMIGLSGCGPTCMTMAYLYFTEDLTMNPKEMAEFAQNQGYHTAEGTSWEFWTTGAAELGLIGETLPLSETVMQAVLDSGGLIICSMSPGDFTTGGHYILLRGYDEKGFFVNDPNRKSNSQKQWDYETLASQIKNLWGIYGT